MDSFSNTQQVVKTYDPNEVQEQPPPEEKEDEENDIMGHLNYRKLQKIKEDFKKQEEGLSMEDFVKIMLVHLPDTRDPVGLVKNLMELFKQIDVNGDEQLEWEEFTGHIIEMGK